MIDVPHGQLYLGEDIDPAKHERAGTPVLLPASDLTTHGVVVGMTGSGKTGLGIDLLEEALLNGVPTLVLDPKGDLPNLLLTFPDLAPADFAPWVEGADAATVAQQWRDGLAGWGIEPARIKALQDAADFTIYTPGSTAGVPLNVVGSMTPPPAGTDQELVHDEIEGFVAGLLGLVGIEADPLASREFILLANLIATAWAAGTTLDLATLVGQVQQPPLRKLGVFELDTFFPPADRTKLAMRLNGLLASPAFAAWAQGPDLDLDTLLWTAERRPRCAIVELAHLADDERQFAVSLILSKLVTWMRTQPGTSDLRVLVYFDEVMGFVPPTAAPPSKKPILTILKQARAFGVGIVLATQNPVDVDYKALSNAGTWMVGRLQTEQDKGRLLDGMSAASGGVDVQAVGDTISALAKREFVLRRAGKDKPEVFTTRWAMSYLRGPLTRDQIATLMAGRDKGGSTAGVAPSEPAPSTPTSPTSPASAAAPSDDDESSVRPEVAAGVPVRWIDAAAPWVATAGGTPGSPRLAPAVAVRAQLLYDDDAAGIRHTEEFEAILFPLTAQPDPAAAHIVDYDDRDFISVGPPGAQYVLGDAPIANKAFFDGVRKAMTEHLFRNRTAQVLRNKPLKLYSRPDETAEQFALRCDQAADVEADRVAVGLQAKYQARIRRAQDAVDTAIDRAAEARSSATNRVTQEIVSDAGSLLGSLFGGRRSARSIARSAGGAMSRRGQSAQANKRVESAQNRVQDKQDALADLHAALAADLQDIAADWDAKAALIEPLTIPLEKSDIAIADISLVWMPC